MKYVLKAIFLFFVLVTVLPVAGQQVINNQFIIDLTKKGVSAESIVTIIQNAKNTDFELSASKISDLRAAGVASQVVAVMATTLLETPSLSTPALNPKALVPPLSATPSPSPSPLTSTASSPATTANNDPLDPVCYKATVLDPKNATNYMRYICDLVKFAAAERELIADSSRTLLTNVVVTKSIKDKFLTPNEEASAFFLEAEKARTDKQVGSGPANAGTTSLAVKGGAPSIIGWAVEQGAATSSVSGTTVTVRVNPFGLLRATQGAGYLGKDFLNSFQSNEDFSRIKPNAGNLSFENFLKKFSTGFSFDTTRGQETPTFIVSKQQLSAVSARYEFKNERIPQSKRAKKLFSQFVKDNTDIFNKYGNSLNALYDENGPIDPVYKAWFDKTNSLIKEVSAPKPGDLVDARRYEEELRAVVESQVEKLPLEEFKKNQSLREALTQYAALSAEYDKKRTDFSKEINKGTVVAFEYTNYREPIAPDTSNFRFIWEKGVLGDTDITFNASLTMYNKKPTIENVRRLRDFQFALQTDSKLDKFFIKDSVLSFAGRYERINTDLVNPLGIVTPNSKGDVAVGQAKLTIPLSIGDFLFKLPLSVTFANRSEFIKESTVRGNFGITLDLDSIFAKLKPF